jgi:hypothetical protein
MIDFAQIREQIPLAAFVEFVGVPLRKDGNCYRAKCPFHGERRGASLIIYSDQHWVCQGKCPDGQRGGDVVRFAQLFWNLPTVAETVSRLLAQESIPQTDQAPERKRIWEPRWPKRELSATDALVREGIDLATLYESSPLALDGRTDPEEFIDLLLPGDPLLCIGKTDFKFATRRRSVWRGSLARFPLMVPTPMWKVWARTQANKVSQHTKAAVAQRVYLVVEFDFSILEHDGKRRTIFADLVEAWGRDQISVADACAALLWHLRSLPSAPPFVMAVHSGGKSLHGWFNVADRAEEQSWPFMRYAYQLGADHVTWCPSQFVRIPEGRRQDGKRQRVFFLDPTKTVTL